MLLLLVLAVWACLALVAGGLFVAIIRGGGGTDLPEITPDVPVALPTQRAASADVGADRASSRAGS